MAQMLFTARHGGTSTGKYSSLNLGDHVGDESIAVANNRRILQNMLSRIVEDSVAPVTADALITRRPGLPLAVLSADCLPILVKGENIVGAIHAGRKGILNGIIERTITKMRELGGSELSATIGPAICCGCYEVDFQMYSDAIEINPNLATTPESHCLDLKKAAAGQLLSQSVSVTDLGICTAHDLNYFSYRRDGISGRSAGVIVL